MWRGVNASNAFLRWRLSYCVCTDCKGCLSQHSCQNKGKRKNKVQWNKEAHFVLGFFFCATEMLQFTTRWQRWSVNMELMIRSCWTSVQYVVCVCTYWLAGILFLSSPRSTSEYFSNYFSLCFPLHLCNYFFLLNKRIQYNVFCDTAERKMKRKHWTRLTLCDVIVNSLWVYSVTRILKYNGRMHEKPKCTLGADRCFKTERKRKCWGWRGGADTWRFSFWSECRSWLWDCRWRKRINNWRSLRH